MTEIDQTELRQDFVAVLNKHHIPRNANVSDTALAIALSEFLPTLIGCMHLDRGMHIVRYHSPITNKPADD